MLTPRLTAALDAVALEKLIPMRMSFYFLILLLLATTIQAQEASPKCVLQQLAIDAAIGDTLAQYNLAVEFFRGANVPQDYAKAANLWRKASDAGDMGHLIISGSSNIMEGRELNETTPKGYAYGVLLLSEDLLRLRFIWGKHTLTADSSRMTSLRLTLGQKQASTTLQE
jgi:hypothetical protein